MYKNIKSSYQRALNGQVKPQVEAHTNTEREKWA